MNTRKSRTVYAILGFLASKPRSGYDIKKAIEKSVGFFWSESYGQIYPMLKKLAEDGYAEKLPPDPHSSRKRQRYAITDKGRAVLADWIKQNADYGGYRNELLLKLFFGHNVGVETSLKHLQDFLEHEKQRLEMFEGFHRTLPDQTNQPVTSMTYLSATLNYGIKGTRMNIEWAKETIQLLKNNKN
ncbi:PadR family transcriptional regulator [Luteithermobacter gelatinilyticus]|uniref:PadR family transcriptional regulator n=1 Tax=Luteithermobacter gelatinilyticus TaxID=2582913 RepID=UPI0011063BAA|nr:PadR family transcriptional regulator [Luteithermobacter gelatinilyticus]|tara:strand:+ start:5411 stop:5968 length:558 start_codon:yes stop_codon:yes gene_type:complete